jgi:transposase-like protein
MPRKRHKPEEIVAKLRQVDVLASQGQTVADAVRSIGVTEVTYHRWRQEYGGLKADQVGRLKALEAESTRLRRAVADLTLDKLILKEAASGNYRAPRGGAPASSTSGTSSGSPSAAPARRSASTARRGARPRGAGTTRSGSPPTSSSSPAGTAATATARSPSCCGPGRAGWPATNGWSGSGGAKG